MNKIPLSAPFDDGLLLDYAEGRLSSKDCADIDRVAAGDPVLLQQLNALRASNLPYAAAFDATFNAPLPQKLLQQVQEWSQLAQAQPMPGRTNPKKQKQRNNWFELPSFAHVLGGRASSGLAIAAYFLGGTALGLWLGAHNLFNIKPELGPITASLPAAMTNPWVQAVADYQRLYLRETVNSLRYDQVATQQVLDDLRSKHGLDVNLPDLKPQGLELRRAQLLGLDQQRFLQAVYLPSAGGPVALCVIKADQQAAPAKGVLNDDSSVSYGVSYGQNLAYWHYKNAKYLLIGSQSEDQIKLLAATVRRAQAQT